jgi:hypothetical protein
VTAAPLARRPRRLTLGIAEHTIAAMPRDTLLTILGQMAGLKREEATFRVAEGHYLTVYLGQPGRAAAIDHVLSITVADAHVEVEARERGTFYVAYDTVHALLHSPRKDRKGPGGVGF